MTQYRTYLDDTTEVGKETISGIQQNGSQFGIGISTDIECNNINCGIITCTSAFIDNITGTATTATDVVGGVGSISSLTVSGVTTSVQGFISIANTTPIQILLNGNQLTFNAVGIGSTTLILS